MYCSYVYWDRLSESCFCFGLAIVDSVKKELKIMAYDEGLAERLRNLLQNQPDVEEKKMFGGLCFLVGKHMCCGIVGDKLMARVGPDNYNAYLSRKHVHEMNFTGKSMKGMVYVEHDGIAEDGDLLFWVDMCLAFVKGLPPKD
jgi:hypothetical protein